MKKMLALSCFLLLGGVVFGQNDPKDLAKALEAEFTGKVFMLRGFPVESNLKFDSQCNPISAITAGSWTLAEMEVEKIEAKGDEVILSGKRSGFVWDSGGPMKKVRLTGSKDKGWKADINLRLEIKGPFNRSPGAFVQEVRNSIFVMDFKEMPDLVPDFWRGYLTGTLPKKPTNEIDKKDEKADPQPVMQSQTGDGVYRVGGKVSEPKPVYSRDPQYNPFARANKFQGTSVVSAVILPDGTVSDVKITRPIGLGLDDEAVRAVRTWQFKPAKKNDQPVAVMINVEVNFRLY